eukprot:CAMPEP_0194441618 /NCGR_PEP_ID=MMETSP0176-20130528/122444_1 /TAXON_ID=216777 /ORGANISM="Proboscia alata, Strain PI-D3" /LENGTH=129 /DNA_ID=CAMNT_0039267119 /DNA_START=24 /DNA_END=413 /DNA_ORIENTATION=-
MKYLPTDSLSAIATVRDASTGLLTLHNEDGGWATYRNQRGFRWYESLNSSEVFGDITIDDSYVECSAASLAAQSFHEVDSEESAGLVSEDRWPPGNPVILLTSPISAGISWNIRNPTVCCCNKCYATGE